MRSQEAGRVDNRAEFKQWAGLRVFPFQAVLAKAVAQKGLDDEIAAHIPA